MDTWAAEPALYRLTLDTWGPERLDSWLREQYAQHDELHGLAITRVWLDIDGGPLLDRLCQWLGGPMALPAARRPGQAIAFYYRAQRLLFNGLLQALPVDALCEPLRERRLALDVGC